MRLARGRRYRPRSGPDTAHRSVYSASRGIARRMWSRWSYETTRRPVGVPHADVDVRIGGVEHPAPGALDRARLIVLVEHELTRPAPGAARARRSTRGQVSILVDGAVELLDQAAAAALDAEDARAAVLERELASRVSAQLIDL